MEQLQMPMNKKLSKAQKPSNGASITEARAAANAMAFMYIVMSMYTTASDKGIAIMVNKVCLR